MVRSPWFGVSMAIAGLIVGYSFVIGTQPLALANEASCPAHHDCKNGDCADSADCAKGKCGSNCPGNCQKDS